MQALHATQNSFIIIYIYGRIKHYLVDPPSIIIHNAPNLEAYTLLEHTTHYFLSDIWIHLTQSQNDTTPLLVFHCGVSSVALNMAIVSWLIAASRRVKEANVKGLRIAKAMLFHGTTGML